MNSSDQRRLTFALTRIGVRVPTALVPGPALAYRQALLASSPTTPYCAQASLDEGPPIGSDFSISVIAPSSILEAELPSWAMAAGTLRA
jgi:hypothetical protein